MFSHESNHSLPEPPPPPPPPRHTYPPPFNKGPPPPPKELATHVLNKPDAIDRAVSNDDDMLTRIAYLTQRQAFRDFLSTHRAEIEAVVAYHLRSRSAKTPLPYKIGEAKYPGNVDEKLRCEVASYLWIQEKSPATPIPKLFGCGFPDGQAFTSPENVPFFTRFAWNLRKVVRSWLRLPTLCHYVARRNPPPLKTGYIIISYITNGARLSYSWESFRHDRARRSNLFRGLAQILLSLNKSHLPRIGSLTLSNRGLITLTNRPLSLELQVLENEGIPTNINRDSTYPAVDLYLLDLITCHNNRIYQQPNSIHSKSDGRQQLAALTMMRAVLHRYINRDYRHGPFVFTLTDLHQSNIFVDDQWNVTSIIDLEWACSLPIEMQCPPYWLSGRSVDDIPDGEHLEAFGQIVEEFLVAVEEEEALMVGSPLGQASLMRECWKSGSFWYFQAVNSPKGMYRIFNGHIQRLFCADHCGTTHFDDVVAPYWSFDAAEVIARKLKEEECYKDRVREALAHDATLANPTRWWFLVNSDTMRHILESQANEEPFPNMTFSIGFHSTPLRIFHRLVRS